jgi:hypothetical protein
MKTLILSGLTAFVLVINAPKAQAGDEAIAAIGGLIGGILIGSAIDDHHYASDGHYRRNHGPSVVIQTNHGRRGHWKYVRVRTWAPGHWVRDYDDCGNGRKYWVQGHYTHRKNKVWVGDRYSRHNNRHNSYSNHRRDRHDSYRDDSRRNRRDRHDRRDRGDRRSSNRYARR